MADEGARIRTRHRYQGIQPSDVDELEPGGDETDEDRGLMARQRRRRGGAVEGLMAGGRADRPRRGLAAGGRLTTAARKSLKSSQFALPGHGTGPEGKGPGSYPIPDASHARNALARVSQHGSSSEKARVRAAVHRKFPGIGQK